MFLTVILDFGFAQYLYGDTEAQMLRGSPLYMAPEIITQRQYSPKADLWSVGVILYGNFFLTLLLFKDDALNALTDPGGVLGPGPPTPNMWEFFKAKEFTMSANQGRIFLLGPPPDPILGPLERLKKMFSYK